MSKYQIKISTDDPTAIDMCFEKCAIILDEFNGSIKPNKDASKILQKRLESQELCECGHDYKKHNYNTMISPKFPGGKTLGDGRCLNFDKDYCKCKKFRLVEQGDKG